MQACDGAKNELISIIALLKLETSADLIKFYTSKYLTSDCTPQVYETFISSHTPRNPMQFL